MKTEQKEKKELEKGKKKFIREAMKAGFTKKQAEFFYKVCFEIY